ncbi:MAG: glycosyl transferase family 2 [Microgenomates group bacterium GW2011_GWC1_37_8]|uniref:Glycosyl transferase family 2 n=1 Tax=Candidatus Woesebacteria bacterium GW2011_GWB1_38_8 TaxID=1618570 RepID=A0A0G0LCZ5_9BACT|nr:MAG: glycosyl transferase family 2 [Microgenomates group bacterium GW2011_GWC1_37_8]KKQ85770.1 MAG: glycosyl transferase family 2 [Candidatus Woesebacteria bacterium GW2011_GWB1_38_8]
MSTKVLPKINKFKVSIIIVFHNGIGSLLRNLESVRENKPRVSYEVIVVDNGSSGRVKKILKKKYKWVKYIKSSRNIGYSGGNNFGAKYANGEYLLILNPDTKVTNGSIDSLVSFLDKNPKSAIVAPNLIHPDASVFEHMGGKELTPLRGVVALSFLNRLFPKNRISRDYFMADIDKNTLREVGFVPGSAFMIRKRIFWKIGGFDENFFLYFEENDLCKKVMELDYKVFINPKSKIIHFWESDKNNENLKRIFRKSRFYYFKKHFGIIKAVSVETSLRISKYELGLLISLLLAAYLRFWNMEKFLNFGGDIGYYFLQARDFILSGKVPLVSIPTSVPILRQGAIWLWILSPFLKLFNFDPIAGALLAGVFGLLSIIALFFVLSSWFSKRIALIAVLLASTSLYLIIHDRMPFQTTPIFLATIVLAHFFRKAVKGKSIYYLLTGAMLSVLYQLELAAFILFLIVGMMLVIYRKNISIQKILFLIAGVFIGLLPFIIYDYRQGLYLQTLGFIAWLFLRVYESLISTGRSGFNPVLFKDAKLYISQFIFYKSYFISLSIFMISLIFLLVKAFGKSSNFEFRFIFLWIYLSIAAFLLRGFISAAYLPLIFFPLIISLAVFFDMVIKKFKYIGWVIFTGIILMNISAVFSYFNEFEKSGVTLYSTRISAAEKLVELSAGREYKLEYFGPGREFQTGDDNWNYLLWWNGNEPKVIAKNIFAIIEYPYKVPEGYKQIIDLGSVKIGKRND